MAQAASPISLAISLATALLTGYEIGSAAADARHAFICVGAIAISIGRRLADGSPPFSGASSATYSSFSRISVERRRRV